MESRAGAMAGTALVVAAIAIFAIADAASKLLAGAFGPFQVVWAKCAIMLVLSLPGLMRHRLSILPKLRLHLLRGALLLVASLTFFHAFSILPLFDAYIVFFTAPFLTMGFSRLLLSEIVTWRGWAWAGLGFAGVMVSLAGAEPSAGQAANAWQGYLSAAIGTVAHALMMISTRRIGGAPLSVSMAIPGAMGVVLLGPLAALTWVTPSLPQAGLLVFNGTIWGIANATLAAAVRLAPPSRLAPFDFSAVVWAIGLDAALFGTHPTPLALAGAGIVIVSCIGHHRAGRG